MNSRSSTVLSLLRRQRRWMTIVMTVIMAFWQIAQPLQAANISWTAGSAANLNWADTTNWNLAVPTASDDVFLGKPIPNPGALVAPNVITLGSGSLARSLAFQDSYTLSGGSLGLFTGNINVDDSVTATINSSLTGTAGLTKLGTGTLRLSANNSTLSGAVNLAGGVLEGYGSASAFGTGGINSRGGEIRLVGDTGLNFANGLTLSGSTVVTSDRVTSGAGVNHTLGNLSIGARTLAVQSGSQVTSGTAGLTLGATTVSANGATFDVGANAALTMGAIGGNFSIFKTGAGTLNLSGASTRSAPAYVTEGVINQTVSAGLGAAASQLVMFGGTSLNLASDTTTNAYPTTLFGSAAFNSNRATAGAAITHTLGTLTSFGNNTLTISRGANITSGTQTQAFGAVIATGSTVYDIASGVQLTFNSTINNSGYNTTFNGAGNATVTGVISGGGGLTKNNDGTLILSAANTYGNETRVNAGTLQLGNAQALGATATANAILTGIGALSTNGLAVSVNSIAGSSNTILQNNNASTAATLTVTPGPNAVSAFAGTVRNGAAGTMAITVNSIFGGGLTLSGNNTQTGATTLTQGRLNVNSNTALGTGAVTLTAGTIDNTSGSAVTLSNNNAVTLGGNVTFGGTNSLNLGNGAVTTAAARVISLRGSNNSVLRFGTYNSNGAGFMTTLNALPDSNSSLTIGTFNSQGSGTAGITTLAGNGNISISDGIKPTITAAQMAFSNSGTITLSGVSNYTGASTFNSGTVVLNNSTAAGSFSTTTNALNFSGGTFRYLGAAAGSTQSLTGAFTLNAGGSKIAVVGGTSGTTTLALGAMTLTTNAGALNIDLSGVGAGVTTSTAVVNQLLAARGAVTVTSGGTTDFATKSGSNIVQLTGQTSFTGTTTGTTTNYTVTGSQTATAAATPNSIKINTTGAGQSLTLGVNTLNITSGGLLFVGANDYSITGSATNALRSATATNSDLIIHNYGTGELNIAAIIANGVGTSVLTLNGPGVTKLSAVNSYTGTTMVTGGATVSIDANSRLGAAATAVTLNNGTLRATAGFDLTRAMTLGAGNGVIEVTGANVLKVTGIISSPIAGTGNLTKTGTGTLQLTAASTYTGGFTNIQDGAIQLSGAGAVASGNIVVFGNGANSGQFRYSNTFWH
jgi:autotransporter-associated beta strand protein